MATEGAPERPQRRGPAPIASFDHDISDESSPETKQPPRLPEIREDPAGQEGWLTTGESRARSHSTPTVGGLPAPRIDISRASSSSHQDSRDSSPELALFAGSAGEDSQQRLELAFREDGALDLRSSTEELAFLEEAPAEPRPAPRRHSRKDSQCSEAALLAVSGRTSRLSSVGSQCSAHSALSGLSRASHLSVVSGVSRSPSPHKMLLETSFCGPRPIETDPEICAAAVEERLLEIAKLAVPPDSRDRREVRAEVTVEIPRVPSTTSAPPVHTTSLEPQTAAAAVITADDDKRRKEVANRVRVEERRTNPKLRREPSEPEVYKTKNRTKNVIRIKLKPDEDYGEDEEIEEVSREPERSLIVSDGPALEVDARVSRAVRPTELMGRAAGSPAPARRSVTRDSRTPSPAAHAPTVSRKSSFCSLFKSRETICSPDSPSGALRRKRSLTEGGIRSKSRDRSSTPTSASKIRGSVLSLFRTPRRSVASPSPSTREGSPIVVQPPRPLLTPSVPPVTHMARLKYYEDTGDGIIHIPLRTPPEERTSARRDSDCEPSGSSVSCVPPCDPPRPASAPVARTAPEPASLLSEKPLHRTVLPDGSIIIPLHSPTDRVAPVEFSNSIPPEHEQTGSPVDTDDDILQNAPTGSRAAADGAEASPARELSGSTHAEEQLHRSQKERTVFTTLVGSRDQVFTTQFSITKTSSVTSDKSTFGDGDDVRLEINGDANIEMKEDVVQEGNTSPQETVEVPRDSSESEGSSETTTVPRAGSEVERRGLVVQESFEDELPYVPTTLPLERSVVLPMVPVRDRNRGVDLRVVPLQRPRASSTIAPPLRPLAPRPPHPVQPLPTGDKLLIRLPHRTRPSTARPRTRSGGDGAESRPREWIDFEEVPERRKQPKRIQTLPGGAAEVGSAVLPAATPLVFSYVEPEHCRCECHGHERPSHPPSIDNSVTVRTQDEQHMEPYVVELNVETTARARPFTTDLDINTDELLFTASSYPVSAGIERH